MTDWKPELAPRYWGTPGFDHSLHDHTLGGECVDSPPLLLRERRRRFAQEKVGVIKRCLVCGMYLNADYTHDWDWGSHQ